MPATTPIAPAAVSASRGIGPYANDFMKSRAAENVDEGVEHA
jgi:hypothetical protein